METAPSGVEYFAASQSLQPDSTVRLIALLHLPDPHRLHLNFPFSSWYSPGLHESHAVRVLGLVVMKPAGQSAHLNEAAAFESEFTIAVEDSKNVPGKQQKV